MAKRHNHYRGRGGRRGGSRSHGSSRGRGGGKFFKGKGKPKSSWSSSNQSLGNGDLANPDLDDVYYGDAIAPDAVEDYYFGSNAKGKSMKMGGFRPGNRNESPESKLAFRKRPMNFVKAKDIYDPSHDLIESLRNENNDVAMQKEMPEHEAEDDLEVDAEGEQEVQPVGVLEIESEEELEVEDDAGEMEKVESKMEESDNEDKQEEHENTDTQDMAALSDSLLFVMDHSDSESSQVENAKIEEDQEDSLNAADYNFAMIADELQLSKNREDNEKVMRGTTGQAPSPHLSGTMETLNITEDNTSFEAKAEPHELPFGAADEDSLVDLSEVAITNVRIGFSDDSYYVKCFPMFGDHEFRWVDKNNLSDFILDELNFPEHRLEAYLNFVKDSFMIPDEPEPSYSDIPISDSDSSVDEAYFDREESVSSDMKEGLDDLIAYTEKYSVLRNQDCETSSLNTMGKGKKKKLLVEESLGLDSATISILEEKFSSRLDQKAKKRRSKQDFIDEQNKFSDDLYKKYPIGLHVQNIKDECELFLERNKDRLRFPPLDPHGNNVILKICHNFNFKGYKEGSGKNTHIVAQKTSRTDRYSPDYDTVSRLLRQRPVFYRVDVDRPRRTTTEKVSSKAKFHTKEGEVVGQDAPEIGKDNIGRKMLEKLGWSNGEGLGAHGNKGIAEPLMAKVKKSKSGLKHD